MKIFDISWPLSDEMTTYKNKDNVLIQPTKTFEADLVRETTLTINSHTGTHIDAPSHFMQYGKSIDQLDPLCSSGPAQVIDMSHVSDCITKNDLINISIAPNQIILFKTKNSTHSPTASFDHNFIYVDSSAASYLVEQSVRAVGIDYLGIERNQPQHETHLIFMQHNIPIIEGLRLQDVQAGIYTLWCLPIKIPGLDGAPARALLIKE
jgi:arylformamidase